MGDTVGEVMHRLFGAYDYVVFKDQYRSVIRRWDKVTPMMEGRKYRSFKMVNGMKMSEMTEVPSDRMSSVYLVFEF